MGQELVGEIRTTISSIQVMPKRFKEVRTGYRRALVHRFNYVIVFRHDELKVTIVAVYHASRNPGTLLRRLDEDQAEGDNDDDPSTSAP
ncbi:type II toxin-antitoxin system RelE/ParE family toxin [Zavarzinella formosa]|uniref:type II toxin-antitoxin system RelE/ParE family toxin n=1 Tax=Zavarzinella formosa TaxID=360055 RepID=UPI00036FC8A5